MQYAVVQLQVVCVGACERIPYAVRNIHAHKRQTTDIAPKEHIDVKILYVRDSHVAMV